MLCVLGRAPIFDCTGDPSVRRVVAESKGRQGVSGGKWLEGLTADMPIERAVELMLERHAATVRAAFAAVLDQGLEDVESIHRLRVATRRLTSVLELFGEVFAGESVQKLKPLLEKIRRDCGPARDLDVQRLFFESLLPSAAADELPGLKYLIECNIDRRLDLQAELRETSAKRRAKFDKRIAMLEGDGEPSGAARTPSRGTLRSFAARLLPERLHEFWQTADSIPADSGNLHELRIAGKRLRYVLDVFAPILDEDFREHAYPEFQRLQDLLGEIQDANVGRKRLKQARRARVRPSIPALKKESRKIASATWKELEPGAKQARAAYAKKDEAARQKLEEFWPQFSGECRASLDKTCAMLEMPATAL